MRLGLKPLAVSPCISTWASSRQIGNPEKRNKGTCMVIRSILFEDVFSYFLAFLFSTDQHQETIICIATHVSQGPLPFFLVKNSKCSISHIWRLGFMTAHWILGRPGRSQEKCLSKCQIKELYVAKYQSTLVFLLPILTFEVIALELEFILSQYYNSFLGLFFK